MKKTSIFLAVLIIFMTLPMPAYAWNAWDIPGTYDVTSEKPATFVIAFVEKDYQTGNNMTVTMIGESSERVLGFKYDNTTGEARMGGNIGDEYFDDLMYIKFDFEGWGALRGEGYMRWGEKGAEKIPFIMVKTDGETESRPSAGEVEVPRDKNGKPIDCGIRFSDISGEVQVRPGDDRLAWDIAELDQVLYHGDVLRLKRGAEVQLSLADMSVFVLRGPAEIIVSLGPEKENKLLLLVGKVIKNVKKMVIDGSLEVEMGQAIAGARGTTYVMEEDGFTSTLKVLEGTVSFKPNNGEELLITDGQMVSATDGVAGEITSFSIEEELSGWTEPTQAMFREILADAGREKKAASGKEISSPENAGEETDYKETLEKEIAKYENHVKMKSFLTYGLGIAIIGLAAAAVIFIRKRRK